MKRVLIADDTKNIRMMLSKCMEISGWKVSCAENGQQALDILTTTEFDLMMLDIKMPELSGTEVLRRLRKSGCQTPVIVMTAYGTIKNAVETTNMGAVAYLQKPFTAEKIRKTLEQISFKPFVTEEEKSDLKEAEALLAQARAQEAFELLTGLLKEDSLNPEIYKLLSQSAQAMGKESDAKQYLILGNALLE